MGSRSDCDGTLPRRTLRNCSRVLSYVSNLLKRPALFYAPGYTSTDIFHPPSRSPFRSNFLYPTSLSSSTDLLSPTGATQQRLPSPPPRLISWCRRPSAQRTFSLRSVSPEARCRLRSYRARTLLLCSQSPSGGVTKPASFSTTRPSSVGSSVASGRCSAFASKSCLLFFLSQNLAELLWN